MLFTALISGYRARVWAHLGHSFFWKCRDSGFSFTWSLEIPFSLYVLVIWVVSRSAALRVWDWLLETSLAVSKAHSHCYAAITIAAFLSGFARFLWPKSRLAYSWFCWWGFDWNRLFSRAFLNPQWICGRLSPRRIWLFVVGGFSYVTVGLLLLLWGRHCWFLHVATWVSFYDSRSFKETKLIIPENQRFL